MPYLTPALAAYFLSLTAVLGLVAGSFCNAWAWRLARGESIARGRSHCAVCAHPLSARDLVPLLSYLLLGGRCRYCGAPISRRYPAVEAGTAVFFVSALLRCGLTLATVRFWLLGCLLLTLALADWETLELSDALLVAAALLSLLRVIEEGARGALAAIVGAVAVSVPLLLFVLLADRVSGKETMGGGDIKLLAVLGLHFGAAQTLLLLVVACPIGLLSAWLGRGRQNPQIPFAPALALAAWAVLLWGAPFLRWYLGLFS